MGATRCSCGVSDGCYDVFVRCPSVVWGGGVVGSSRCSKRCEIVVCVCVFGPEFPAIHELIADISLHDSDMQVC